MTKSAVATITVLLIATCCRAALAAPTETGETGLITMPTTAVLHPWGFSLGVAENGEIDNSQPGDSPVELYRTEFTLAVGLLPDLELSAHLPYIEFQRSVPGNQHTNDIGGLRLGLKYRLCDETREAPISFALLAAVVVGTGRDSFPAIVDRASAWGRRETYEVMGIVDKVLGKTAGDADATFTLNAGGLFFDKPQSFSARNQTFQFQRRFIGPDATFEDPFEFGAAINLPVIARTEGEVDALAEFRGNTGIIDEVRGALPTWMFTGLRLTGASGFGIQGGADFGLSGFLEPYRFIAGVSYVTPAPR